MAVRAAPSGDTSDDTGIVAEINITPLTDIFLVLLIIFMVTTSMISNQGKEVDLPSAAVAATSPAGVTVTVEADGAISVDGQTVALDGLRVVLEDALAAAREKVVILRGDRQVVLGRAVGILDLAQQAGATGIALATKPEGPGGAAGGG